MTSDLVHAGLAGLCVVAVAVLSALGDVSSTVTAAVLTGAVGFAAGRSGV